MLNSLQRSCGAPMANKVKTSHHDTYVHVYQSFQGRNRTSSGQRSRQTLQIRYGTPRHRSIGRGHAKGKTGLRGVRWQSVGYHDQTKRGLSNQRYSEVEGRTCFAWATPQGSVPPGVGPRMVNPRIAKWRSRFSRGLAIQTVRLWPDGNPPGSFYNVAMERT